MALSESGGQLESALRELLPRKGYKLLNSSRRRGETGADIIAEKDRMRVFIECIGFQENPPLRSKQFYEVFFRAISRLKDGANKCVIALPARFKRGRKERAKQYGKAWKRIGDAFPELEIWSVNLRDNSYEEHKWNGWPGDCLDNLRSVDAVSHCTEESHLKGCNENVKGIYRKLKQSFISARNKLQFRPTMGYVGVVDTIRIAYIKPKMKKVRLIILMAENEVGNILRSGHHTIVSHSERTQRYWGGKHPNCSIEITDTGHWEEIQELLAELVKKHQNE